MASFEDYIHSDENLSQNFKGYVGNPPTTQEEYESLNCWVDGFTPPTWEEVSVGCDLATVRANRRFNYPDIGSQLDLLYHDIKNGNLESGSWVTAIEEIKQQYPK